MRYELRVLVGFKRAHRGWSKVYTAPAALRPPFKNARNYNGFGASGSKSKQKPMVFLPLSVRRSPKRGITLVLAPARLEVNGIDVFPIGILTTKSFFWRGMVRSLKPLFF